MVDKPHFVKSLDEVYPIEQQEIEQDLYLLHEINIDDIKAREKASAVVCRDIGYMIYK